MFNDECAFLSRIYEKHKNKNTYYIIYVDISVQIKSNLIKIIFIGLI